jgi:hypothetical protein
VFKFSIPRIDEAIRPFKATLTWTDPYSSATSGSPVLHDLDITVTSDLTGVLTYPNGRSDRDSLNNVGPPLQSSPGNSTQPLGSMHVSFFCVVLSVDLICAAICW